MEPGLYLVATPIGNLDDITIRALNVLKILKLFSVKIPIIAKSFKNIQLKLSVINIPIMILMKKRRNITKAKKKKIINLILILVLLISDPGNQLINFLFENNVKIFSIPLMH